MLPNHPRPKPFPMPALNRLARGYTRMIRGSCEIQISDRSCCIHSHRHCLPVLYGEAAKRNYGQRFSRVNEAREMTHLGYGKYLCRTCKDYTDHRIVECKLTNGETVAIKLCNKCKPEVKKV